MIFSMLYALGVLRALCGLINPKLSDLVDSTSKGSTMHVILSPP
jgi:hypothetical protein